MPISIGSGVSLQGLQSEDFEYTWNVTGSGGVSPLTAALVAGYAVTQDTTADNAIKVGPAAVTLNSLIVGDLVTYENRVQEGIIVGTVRHKGVFTWEYTGTAPTRGQGVAASATPGKVVAATGLAGNLVVAVDTTALTVTVKFD